MTFSGRGCILTAVKNACAGNAIRFANNIYHLNGFLVAEGGVQGRPLDARGRNITANVVQPGVMPTDMSAEVFGENVSDAVLDQHPIRRIATLEEVAWPASWPVREAAISRAKPSACPAASGGNPKTKSRPPCGGRLSQQRPGRCQQCSETN